MTKMNRFFCILGAHAFFLGAVFQAFFYTGVLLGAEESATSDYQSGDQRTLPTITGIKSALTRVIARSRSDQEAYNQLGRLAALLSERYILRTFIATSAVAGIPENISCVRRQLNIMQLFYDQLTPEMRAILHDIDSYCESTCETSFGVIEKICNAFILATDSFYDALNRCEAGLDDLLAAIIEQLGENCDTELVNTFISELLPDENECLDMLNSNDFKLLKRRVYRFEEKVLQWVKKITRRSESQTKKKVFSIVHKQIKQLRENFEGPLRDVVTLLKSVRASLRYVRKLSFRMPRFSSAMHALSTDLYDALFECENRPPTTYALETLPERYRQASPQAQAQCIRYLKDYAVYYHHALELMDILMHLDPKMVNDTSSGPILNAENWKFDWALRELILNDWPRFTAFIREKFRGELNKITELRQRHNAEFSELIYEHLDMFTKLFTSKIDTLGDQGLDEETLYKALLYPLISEGNSLTFPLWPAEIFNYLMEPLELLSGQKLRMQRSCSWDSYVKTLIREFKEQVEGSSRTRRRFKKIGFNNFVKLEWLGTPLDNNHGLPGGGPSLSQPDDAQQPRKGPKKTKKNKSRRRRKAPAKTSCSHVQKDQASETQLQTAYMIKSPTDVVQDGQDGVCDASSPEAVKRLVHPEEEPLAQVDDRHIDGKNNVDEGDKAVSQVTRRSARQRALVLDGCFEPNFRILARSDNMVVARYWRGLKMGENVLLILYRLPGLSRPDQEACNLHLDPAILPGKDDQPEHKWDIYHAFPEEIEAFLPTLGIVLEPGDDLWRELGLGEQRAGSTLFGTGYVVAIGAKLIRGSSEHPTLGRAQQLIDKRIGHRGCFVWLVRSDTERTVYHRMFHRTHDLR